MGAASAKFATIEVGKGNVTGSLGKCISPSCVSKNGPMKLTMKADTWNKTTTVTDDATGAVVLTTKAKVGFTKLTLTVCDGSGAEICIASGSNGLTSAAFTIYKSTPSFDGQAKQDQGYVFATGRIKKGMGVGECTYSLIKAGDAESVAQPLYELTKVGRMGE